jgi:hypothetical protein
MLRTLVENGSYTVIHDYEDRSREFDASYGHIDILPLENQEYEELLLDLNTAVNVGPIIISIYSDISGTAFIKDSNNNDINLRLVKSHSYTYPFMDICGNYVNGTFTVVFDDGSTFFNSDDDDIYDAGLEYPYWYYLQGVNDINSLKKFT